MSDDIVERLRAYPWNRLLAHKRMQEDVDEIERLRARVEVLEREVERLEQKSEKDWKWFSDATGR